MGADIQSFLGPIVTPGGGAGDAAVQTINAAGVV